jgi:prepilin-type N-terminal cleavage/methylation domain-containing protein
MAMMKNEKNKFGKLDRAARLRCPVVRGLVPKVQGGFGLLELIIAMAILAIGMLGIMKLQMQSGFGNAASRQNTAAVNLARSQMEKIRRIGAYTYGAATIDELIDSPANDTTNDLDDWATPDHTEGPFNEGMDPSAGGKIYTTSWNVVHDHPIVGFKTIRIRVSWTTMAEEKHVDIETQIGRKRSKYFN